MKRFLVVAFILTWIPGGCSRPLEDKWVRARPTTHRVTGRVEIAGAPVAGAKVVFHTDNPVNGRDYSAFGYTNGSGGFSLQTFRDEDGAVAGEHRVTIEKVTWEQPPPADLGGVAPPPVETSHLPKKYRSTKTSGLTAEVTERGPNEFVFELSSK